MDINKNESEPEVIEIDSPGKINFFKKIWFSIAKPSKYEDMVEEGLFPSIKYFFLILAIVVIIIAIISTILQNNVINDAASYLENNLPEMKFKDNTLTLENGEATILDDKEFITYFKCIAIINPLLKQDEAIKEYNNLTTQYYNVVVFLSDKYVVINNNYNAEKSKDIGIEVHHYKDEVSNYVKDTSVEYGKAHVIEYIKASNSYTYYFAQYFVLYLGLIGLLFGVYIILILLSLWMVTKLSKINWRITKCWTIVNYAATLSLFIYTIYSIIGYFTKFSIGFMDVINILLIYLYPLILIYRDKKKIFKDEKAKKEQGKTI